MKVTADVNIMLERIKKPVLQAVSDKLNTNEMKRKQECMRSKILEYKNRYKKQGMAKYRVIHRLTRERIREAKKKYMEDRCREIEALHAGHD